MQRDLGPYDLMILFWSSCCLILQLSKDEVAGKGEMLYDQIFGSLYMDDKQLKKFGVRGQEHQGNVISIWKPPQYGNELSVLEQCFHPAKSMQLLLLLLLLLTHPPTHPVPSPLGEKIIRKERQIEKKERLQRILGRKVRVWHRIQLMPTWEVGSASLPSPPPW